MNVAGCREVIPSGSGVLLTPRAVPTSRLDGVVTGPRMMQSITPMPATGERVFTVRLELDQIDAVRGEQERTGATPGEIIRRAVRAYLARAPRRRTEGAVMACFICQNPNRAATTAADVAIQCEFCGTYQIEDFRLAPVLGNPANADLRLRNGLAAHTRQANMQNERRSTPSTITRR